MQQQNVYDVPRPGRGDHIAGAGMWNFQQLRILWQTGNDQSPCLRHFCIYFESVVSYLLILCIISKVGRLGDPVVNLEYAWSWSGSNLGTVFLVRRNTNCRAHLIAWASTIQRESTRAEGPELTVGYMYIYIWARTIVVVDGAAAKSLLIDLDLSYYTGSVKVYLGEKYACKDTTD